MDDQSLSMVAKLTLKLRYDELHDADGWGENSLATARTMNVVCLSGRGIGRNTSDAGR
jgi:hypothetical protein